MKSKHNDKEFQITNFLFSIYKKENIIFLTVGERETTKELSTCSNKLSLKCWWIAKPVFELLKTKI